MRQQFIFATAQIGRIFAKIESSGANIFLCILLPQNNRAFSPKLCERQ